MQMRPRGSRSPRALAHAEPGDALSPFRATRAPPPRRSDPPRGIHASRLRRRNPACGTRARRLRRASHRALQAGRSPLRRGQAPMQDDHLAAPDEYHRRRSGRAWRPVRPALVNGAPQPVARVPALDDGVRGDEAKGQSCEQRLVERTKVALAKRRRVGRVDGGEARPLEVCWSSASHGWRAPSGCDATNGERCAPARWSIGHAGARSRGSPPRARETHRRRRASRVSGRPRRRAAAMRSKYIRA